MAAPFLSIQCASASRGTGGRTRAVGAPRLHHGRKEKVPFGGKGTAPPLAPPLVDLASVGERCGQREKGLGGEKVGKGSPATCLSPVAGGETSGAVFSAGFSSRRRGLAAVGQRSNGDGSERGKWGLGFSLPLGAVLSQQERRWTVRLNPTASSARCWLAGRWAVSGWARRASCGWYLPHRGAKRASRLWAADASGQIVFFLLFFPENSFNCFFAQSLSKFLIVFSYSNYSNKNLFREFKSYRNFF
jgi:hypothetical protein